MANNFKIHSINMAIQAKKIEAIFPNSNPSFNAHSLTWKYTLTPSPMSNSYDVKLSYIKDKQPNVYIVNPILELYPGQKKLPHVYDNQKQWLCLYYRKGKQWNSSMLLVDTIIPWTSEWLFHYECWLATGKWHGGGIEHGVVKNKAVIKFNRQ
jgi:hypothetical protein